MTFYFFVFFYRLEFQLKMKHRIKLVNNIEFPSATVRYYYSFIKDINNFLSFLIEKCYIQDEY